MPSREQMVEIRAQRVVSELFADFQDGSKGRRSMIRFSDFEPDVATRIRQILAGETRPRFENPDD